MNSQLYGVVVAMVLVTFMADAGASAQVKKTTRIEQKEQPFALKMGATRVIYAPDSAGATLTVTNPQDYPMLVKSQVLDEDKKTVAPFIVTPPLFRLDGLQSSRLRLISSSRDFTPDRETLKWLCVTGIPPKKDDAWAKDESGKVPDHAILNVQLSVSSCIKLLVRPSGLKGRPEEVADGLTWHRQGGRLRADNPTPFYISLKSVSVGGKPVESVEYVPPRGSQTFTLPAGAAGRVKWQILTDLGGDSRIYEAALQ